MSEDKQGQTKMSRVNKNQATKKTKRKYTFKWIHLIPITFVVCVIGFGIYIVSSLNTSGPVYAKRCSSGIKIEETKLTEASDAIKNINGIADAKVSVDCLIVKLSLNLNDDVDIAMAKEISTEATHELDRVLGFEKNSEEDAYSKIFSTDGNKRQYDLELILYGTQEGFPVFGTKQYLNNDITFTDANPKDEALVENIYSNQETIEE